LQDGKTGAGILNWQSYSVLLEASVLLSAASSFFAIFLGDLAFRRYHRTQDLALLFLAAFVENVGYRQLMAWWGCVGTWQMLRGGGTWGSIKRKALATRPIARV
jgi:hypothetical protein